jgi:hypothetical protein
LAEQIFFWTDRKVTNDSFQSNCLLARTNPGKEGAFSPAHSRTTRSDRNERRHRKAIESDRSIDGPAGMAGSSLGSAPETSGHPNANKPGKSPKTKDASVSNNGSPHRTCIMPTVLTNLITKPLKIDASTPSPPKIEFPRPHEPDPHGGLIPAPQVVSMPLTPIYRS